MDDLDKFLAANKTASSDITNPEIDAMLGLKISEGPEYQGPDAHEFPPEATGLEAAGRKATPEEEKKQRTIYPVGIEVQSGNK